MSDDGDGRADESVPDDAAERSDDSSAARGVGATDGSDGANGSVAADGEDLGDSGGVNDGSDANEFDAGGANDGGDVNDGEDVNDGGDANADGANDGGDANAADDAPALGDLQGHAETLEERVDVLHEQARDARAAFEPPEDPEERALTYCREGLWPVLAVYVDRRGARAALGQPHHDRLEDALNTWLELYARCYGVEIDPAFSVREAAELFVSTHNVLDVAQLLTDVPDRRAGDGT